MRGRLRRGLLLVAAFLRDVSGVALMLLGVALVFLLFSHTGTVLSVRAVERFTGLIAVDEIEGRLWSAVTLRGVRFENDGARVDLDWVELEWSPLALLLRRAQVERLAAGDLRVEIKPTPPKEEEPSAPITRLPVALLVEQASVQRLTLQLDEDSEPIKLEGIALSADWRGPRIVLRRLEAVTPWVGAATLAGEAKLLEDGLEIAELLAEGFVQAQLRGRLGYDTPSDLHLQWTQLRWPPEGEPQVTSARGELQWSGLFDDYRYRLQAQLSAAGFDSDVQAHGHGSLSRITAEELVAKLLDGELRAKVLADWSDALRLEADGRVLKLNPARAHAQLQGRINGHFQARTRVAEGQPTVDFSAELTDSQLHGYPLTLDLRGRYADEAVDLAQARLTSGGSRVQASGRVYPRLAVQASLDSTDLRSLWPELQGRAQLTASATGDYARPAVRANGEIGQLRYGDIRADSARLDVDVDLSRHLQLRLDASGLDVGRLVQQLRVTVDGSPTDHRIAANADTPDGSVALALQGQLDLDRPEWRGELTEGRLAPTALAAWTLEQPAALVLGPGVDLQTLCWRSGEAARACLRARVQGAAQEYAVQLQRFELGSLAPLLPSDLKLSGLLDGEATVALDARGLHELQAELVSGVGELRRAGLPPLQWQPARLSAEETQQGLIAELELPFAGGRLSGQARLAPGADLMQRALDGHAQVELPDIAFLQSLSAELQEVTGRLDGRFDFDGTLSQPLAQGRLALSQASLRLLTPGIELREVQASVAANGAEPIVVRARARADEGELYVGGEIDPWTTPLRLDFKLSGYNAQVVRTPEARIWISPNLTVALAQGELRVTGTVEVPRAEIAPKNLDSGVSASSDQIIITSDSDEPQSAIAVFAEVGLLLGSQVRLDAFGLKTRLTGNLQLIEAPGTPTSGRGEINLLEGRYQAYGQDLTIETGRLLFTGGPVTQPAVELRATRKPREDISVGVLVRGTLDKPLLSLFSTPSMSQQQQLSWLVLGRDLDAAGGEGDQALLAGAALSMGLAGGEWLAQRFGGGLGLDEISLGAKPGESVEQAQFTVGKYLRPGLFISYGIGLFQPGHTFKLEYDIGRGFKLATESGVESGGDVLYTVERRAKPREPESAE